MYKIYKIREGDTLESIAKKYNTTLETLYEINGIDKNYKVKPDAYIIVPTVREQLFDSYVVKKGDTIYDIAKRLGVIVDDLMELNGLMPYDYIYADQILLIPKEKVKFHITKEGDTLESVAKLIDANAGELLFQNSNIYLMPGQLIVHKENKQG